MSADPPPSLAELPRGHRFSPVSFRLSAADVSRYLAAVGDASPAYHDGGRLTWAPPLAAAALTLKAVTDQVRLPAGSLHVGQELEFRRPLPVDSELTARAALTQRSEMRGMAVAGIEIDISVAGDSGAAVLARSMVMVPLAEGRGTAGG